MPNKEESVDRRKDISALEAYEYSCTARRLIRLVLALADIIDAAKGEVDLLPDQLDKKSSPGTDGYDRQANIR